MQFLLRYRQRIRCRRICRQRSFIFSSREATAGTPPAWWSRGHTSSFLLWLSCSSKVQDNWPYRWPPCRYVHRKIRREILQLHSMGFNKTEIASSCQCARNTVAATLQRAANCRAAYAVGRADFSQRRTQLENSCFQRKQESLRFLRGSPVLTRAHIQ